MRVVSWVGIGLATAWLRFPLAANAEPPVIAIVAHNAGTETTDFLVPFSVLSAARVGSVVPVALRTGRVELHPALAFDAAESLASFDARYPEGAEFVIVPALMVDDDPELQAWLREQAKRGATLVSICDGAFVLAKAGLLEGHTATAHWASIDRLKRDFAGTRWVRDRRYVDSGKVLSTAGVSASIPASLALIERLAGEARARDVAASLGVVNWEPQHDSSAFTWPPLILRAALNWLAFWKHERVGLRVAPGVDELALGVMADALARTWLSEPVAIAATPSVVTRHGLRMLTGSEPVDRFEPLPAATPSETALDVAVDGIAARYGAATAELVSTQLELPRSDRR